MMQTSGYTAACKTEISFNATFILLLMSLCTITLRIEIQQMIKLSGSNREFPIKPIKANYKLVVYS